MSSLRMIVVYAMEIYIVSTRQLKKQVGRSCLFKKNTMPTHSMFFIHFSVSEESVVAVVVLNHDERAVV